jgi:hypothetical protein
VYYKPSHKYPQRRGNVKKNKNNGKSRKKKESEAADLWACHFVARRSQGAAAMLPPHASWPAQISGCAIRVYL